MYIGIDLGTSGVKAILLNEQGEVVASHTEKLTVSRPHPLWSEQDPEQWWLATDTAMKALGAQHSLRDVKALGIAGQMHGATLLDKSLQVLRPAILWNDGRCAEECQLLEDKVSASRQITGNLMMPGFTAPKLLWVQRHEAAVFSQVDKVLLPKDYLRLRMTGELASDMSDAAGTMWLDVARRDWSDEMLAACDLSRDAMPALFEGSDVTGQLRPEVAQAWNMPPALVDVKDTVRPTYAIKDETEAVENGKRMVVTAPLPLMPIYKGMPGASMLAEILLQKYEYHVPFYRQVKQPEHLGVKLSRNTLNGWFKPVCELLRPLYLELKKKVLSSDYIQVDETTLPVIDHDRHKAAKEYIWIVRAAVPRLLFFHYANGSRSQKVAVDLLKTFKGYLQCDGYSAYDAFENRKDVRLCGCLAHIRRHIESCREENREYAMQGLKFIQDLYNVEYMADERQLSYEERAALRQRLAGPLLDAFELWLQNTYPKVLKRSLMGKAIAYAYPLIPRMRHYLYDGRIFIDNNRAENALRPMVLTRKNMLFCGNQQAAENTAVICSLLGSCKECGVNPREWLNDVISKLPYYLTPKSEKKLTELLPDRWGGYRQSHDTLPTVTGMSMDNPRTVHRQTVHAT